MIEQLTSVGKDMLPGLEFTAGEPDGEVDLAICLGDTPFDVRARRRIRLNAEAWAGIIMSEDEPRRWHAALWPLGALAAAGMGAGEAFKITMYKADHPPLHCHVRKDGNSIGKFNLETNTWMTGPKRHKAQANAAIARWRKEYGI